MLCPFSTHDSPKRCLLLIPISRSDFGFFPSMASSPTKPRDLGHSQEPHWEKEPLSVWGDTRPLYSGVSKLLPCPNPKTLTKFLAVPRFLLRMRYPITVVHAMEKTKLGQNGKLCLLVSIASSPALSRWWSTEAPLPSCDTESRRVPQALTGGQGEPALLKSSQ